MDILVWLPFVLGLIIGVVLMIVIPFVHKPSGTLRIDHSNPEKDVYRFDIDDLDSLSKKARIVLRVDNEADLSQK